MSAREVGDYKAQIKEKNLNEYNSYNRDYSKELSREKKYEEILKEGSFIKNKGNEALKERSFSRKNDKNETNSRNFNSNNMGNNSYIVSNSPKSKSSADELKNENPKLKKKQLLSKTVIDHNLHKNKTKINGFKIFETSNRYKHDYRDNDRVEEFKNNSTKLENSFEKQKDRIPYKPDLVNKLYLFLGRRN